MVTCCLVYNNVTFHSDSLSKTRHVPSEHKMNTRCRCSFCLVRKSPKAMSHTWTLHGCTKLVMKCKKPTKKQLQSLMLQCFVAVNMCAASGCCLCLWICHRHRDFIVHSYASWKLRNLQWNGPKGCLKQRRFDLIFCHYLPVLSPQHFYLH